MDILSKKSKRAFLRASKGAEAIMRHHDSVAYCFNRTDRFTGGGLNCDNVEANGIYSTRSLIDWDAVEKANKESI